MDKRQTRLRRGGGGGLCVSELTLFFAPVVKENGGGGVGVVVGRGTIGGGGVGIIVLKCIALCEASIQRLRVVQAVQQRNLGNSAAGQCNRNGGSSLVLYKKEMNALLAARHSSTMQRKESPCSSSVGATRGGGGAFRCCVALDMNTCFLLRLCADWAVWETAEHRWVQ